jgi:plastocyanin
MSTNEPSSRPDLMGEVRLRLPLPLVVPIAAIIVIAAFAFGFSRVLLTVPSEVATILALVTAANILIACALVALRPRMHRVGLMEVVLIALYPVLIGVVIANTGIGEESAGAEAPAAQERSTTAAGADATLTAASVQFDTNEITLPASKDVVVALDNQDAAPHNLAIYKSKQDADNQSNAVFDGSDVAAGSTTDYKFTAPPPGDYLFQCDIHPSMNGTVTAE